MTNSEIRRQFKTKQQYGDVTVIAKSLRNKFSLSHVSNVLAGRRNNDQILNKAQQLVTKRQKVAA